MKQEFLTYQSQTTPHPLGLEISHASGSLIYDHKGRAYLDFIAGVSACSLGHGHPAVVAAVKAQADRYMHVMVYGEFIQAPALELCQELAAVLPEPLQTTYLVNSGTEAMEGALKLARRITGRSELIAAETLGRCIIEAWDPDGRRLADLDGAAETLLLRADGGLLPVVVTAVAVTDQRFAGIELGGTKIVCGMQH